MRILHALLALMLGTGTWARADDGLFHLETRDGATPPRTLQSVGADGTVLLGEKRFPSKEWAELRQTGQLLPASPSQRFIQLSQGDRIVWNAKRTPSVVNGRCEFEPEAPLRNSEGMPWSLFGPYVAMIVHKSPQSTEDPDSFFRRFTEQERTADVVVRTNGDRIEGTFQTLDAEKGCVLRTETRDVQVPWRELSLLAFRTGRLSKPKTTKLHYHAVLTNGSRIQCTAMTLDEKGPFVGKTFFGSSVLIPRESIVLLQVRNGPVDYLSDRKPTSYRHQSFLGPSWPLVADGSGLGKSIVLGDQVYDKGLGLHTQSETRFALDGQFSWFEALVGMDPAAGSKGRAKVAVLLDGKRHDVHGDKDLRVQDDPVPVRLNVQGVREMTLLVEFGVLGDVQGHTLWANARLWKK